jgi:tRNA threonylcarbamoyl adenosine modification protein (Sua5/YciO/YrdC/YwlC family)
LSDGRSALEDAAKELRAGGAIVFPTDTVYGIGADAFNQFATARIFQAKQRPRVMPLPILVARPRQAWALCATVPKEATELVAAFWPGALTLILPEADGLSWDIGETRGRVAVRMPAHDDLLELILMVGPLAATSANRSGSPTPRNLQEIAASLGNEVALYLDGGPAPGDVPSTIVDLTSRRPKVVREGAIPAADIEKTLA